MTARAAILGRLRQAERTGRLPAIDADPIVPQSAMLSDDERLARFVGELAALGVEPHIETSDAGVRARVTAIVTRERVFAWDAAWLPYDVASALPPSTIRGDSPRSEQAAATIGVTGCDGGIAETGSLVVLAGEGRPRSASLLPPVHLAVVRRGDLYASMGEYFRDRADAVAAASSVMIVTGPSRTADIELTLTVGVHGPGKVIVVIGP